MSTDHLVLRIDEIVKDKYSPDVMFVFYDPVVHMYMIRGKAGGSKSIPYSFSCESKSDVMDFIRTIFPTFVTDRKIRKCNLSLINYYDWPFNSDEVTFYALFDNHDRENEIMGLDKDDMDSDTLHRFLRILRYVRNDYVEV
jgi:hypothetical protein